MPLSSGKDICQQDMAAEPYGSFNARCQKRLFRSRPERYQWKIMAQPHEGTMKM